MDRFIAMLLWLLVAGKILQKPHDSKDTNEKANHESDSASHRIRPEPNVPPVVVNQTKTEQSKKQWWPQTFKEWAEVVGVFVLVIYTGTTVALWLNSSEQLEILSQSRDRPWIKFSEDTITLDNGVVFKPSGDGVSMTIEHTFRLENIGKIPAINYSTWAEPTYRDAHGELPQHFWSTTTCNAAKKKLRIIYGGAEIKGAAIFPGPAVESRVSGSVFIPSSVKELGFIYIGVCVAYEEPNAEIRSTAFLYCQQWGDQRRAKVLDRPELWWQYQTSEFKVCSVDVDDPHRKQ